jgi:hypothetical protein
MRTRDASLGAMVLALVLCATGPAVVAEGPTYTPPRWSAESYPGANTSPPPWGWGPQGAGSSQLPSGGVVAPGGPTIPPPVVPAPTPEAPAPTTPPGAPAPEAAPSPPAAAPPTAAPAPTAPAPAPTAAAAPTSSPGLGGATSLGGGAFTMIGDMGPFSALQQTGGGRFPPLPRPIPPGRPPGTVGQPPAAALVPSTRGLKIAENQSPRPQDRIFTDFNYYDDINGAVNRRLLSPIGDARLYQWLFGLEKTFLDQRASLGARLPLNTLSTSSNIPGVGGTSTSLGNPTFFAKYALVDDRQTGNLISTGLAVTVPTGPRAFAGNGLFTNFNSTQLQPFVGVIRNWGDFFFHGFSAIDVPLDERDATVLFNDFGVGYFLYREPYAQEFLTAVVPTFEVHVNTPLNHRGVFPADRASIPDVVNLTYGTNFEFFHRAVLTLAFVTPVTGPRPFDFEAVAFLNIFYGPTRNRAVPTFPAVIR